VVVAYLPVGATAVTPTPASFWFPWLAVTVHEIVPVTVWANAGATLHSKNAGNSTSAATRMLHLVRGWR
jgi:hypothetical protein